MDKNFSNETEKDIKVTEDDIYSALRKAGIKDEDTVIVHFSLKSFGRVEGGAETVIAALKRSVARGDACVSRVQIQKSQPGLQRMGR